MTKNKNDAFDLKDFVVGFIENFIKKIGAEIIEDVKQKSREIVEQLKRKTAGIFLITFGVIFFLVGAAIALENLLGGTGLGYLIIGFFIFTAGLILNIKK